MDITSDKSLWYFFKKGDLNAFKALFKIHYPPLYAYGVKLSNDSNLTEDYLQNFFIYLYENRENLGDVNNIKSYLFISFKRRLIKQLQQQNLRTSFSEQTPLEQEIMFSPQELAVKQEVQFLCTRTLHNLLNDLAKREREVIYFRYYCDMTTIEISEVMEIKSQSVLNILQKAMI
jgi:RNA polymerase sigma factor (sigma-70 family)